MQAAKELDGDRSPSGIAQGRGRSRPWRGWTISATPRAPLPTAVMRAAMQKAMQEDAAVFRTGETLEQGMTAHRRIIYAQRGDIGIKDRSHDLEHRSGGDAGVRQSDPAGGGDRGRRGQPAGKPRRPCARGLSPARRPELDEAHPGLAGSPRPARRGSIIARCTPTRSPTTWNISRPRRGPTKSQGTFVPGAAL